MTDSDLRAAPTAAGTTSAPMARAAAVDVFEAAPLGLVVWSNGSALAEVRSVGRTGRAWAVIGLLREAARERPAGCRPGRRARLAGGRTEVVVGSGERKED